MSQLQEELSDALDRELLKGVTSGITIIDKDGNPVKIDPPAALLNVARQRLKDLGIPAIGAPSSGLEQLAAELQRHGAIPKFEVMPLNDEPDEAVPEREAGSK